VVKNVTKAAERTSKSLFNESAQVLSHGENVAQTGGDWRNQAEAMEESYLYFLDNFCAFTQMTPK